MRLCIFGAGAIGGYLAARLARAGRDVSLVARGAHLQAILAQGLTLEAPDERFTVHPKASDDPARLGPQDLVIVSTKTPALPQVARSIEPLLTPATTVIFAVNGVFWFYPHGFAPNGITPASPRLDPTGLLGRLVGVERSLGMVIYAPGEVVAPGIVRAGRAAAEDRFVVGAPTPDGRERAQAAAAALDGAGFAVEVSDEIRLAMWKKLAHNVSASPLCALTGADLKTAFASPGMRAIGTAVLRELLAVAASHGFGDLGIPDPKAQFDRSGALAHKPSILQDVERGRPLEIDTLMGAVHDFGQQAGVPTPTLDIVLTLLTMRAQVAGCYPAGAAAG